MFRRFFVIPVALIAVSIISSCSLLNNPAKIKTYVEVKTTEGSFILGLYEGTPLHKDNFIKNSNENVYDSTLIYSTIPNSIHKFGLKPGKKEEHLLNRTKDGSKINQEINPQLMNKTGAVGMLRANNDKNPEMQSDNYLFYLVEGIKTDEKLLKTLEAKRNAPIIADYITVFLSEPGHQHYDDSLRLYKSTGNKDNYRELYIQLTDSIKPRLKEDGIELFSLSKKQISTYTEFGGVPIYDGQYTIFGEIVAGIDILENLSSIKTGLYNKPVNDIYILSTRIIPKKEFKQVKKTY